MTPELFVKDFFEAFYGKRVTEARCKQFLLIRLRYFEQEIEKKLSGKSNDR